MKTIKRVSLVLVLGISLFCGTALAEVTYEIICEGSATDISADGTVVVGNTNGDFETFRWTAETGMVRLGMASAYLGTMAGTPDASTYGQYVSGTILGADSTYTTQGVWYGETGWTETMPPAPADSGPNNDEDFGSCWGMSDDGQIVVGLYWRMGFPGGTANACYWTRETGVVSLGSSGGNSRANDVNADGSVIVGWDENPDWGGWRPTVWVEGVLTTLESPEAFCEAACVNPDGTIIGGMTYDESTRIRDAAAWYWTGTEWQKQRLGHLTGTFGDYGSVMVNDMSADGTTMVGWNSFDWSNSTGFIWTIENGMEDVEDYLTDNGIELDPMFNILTLTGVSDDGKVMCGLGQDMVFPFTYRSFIVRTEDAVAAVPVAALSLELESNYPNPFNPTTTIPVVAGADGSAKLEIYGVNGRLVRTLHNGMLTTGRHEITWDGRNEQGSTVASGTYYARLSDHSGAASSRQMVLLK